VAKFQIRPSLVLTNSLCSLQLLSFWCQRSTSKVLSCPEQAEVRRFLAQWADQCFPPAWEKVKAHDDAALCSGSLKAFGNDRVDGLAKEAARGAYMSFNPDLRFADVVLFKDASGALISDVGQAVTLQWWEQQRRAGAARRTWLARLYPDGEDLDWKASAHSRPPPVRGPKGGVWGIHFSCPTRYFEVGCPCSDWGSGHSSSTGQLWCAWSVLFSLSLLPRVERG
jgi:hypothetical protein